MNGIREQRTSQSQRMNLHEACEAGDMERVCALVTEGACVCAARAPDGDTPLHIACRRSFLNLATFLYERGGDMTVRNADGSAPFHLLRGVNCTHFPLSRAATRKMPARSRTTRTTIYTWMWTLMPTFHSHSSSCAPPSGPARARSNPWDSSRTSTYCPDPRQSIEKHTRTTPSVHSHPAHGP